VFIPLHDRNALKHIRRQYVTFGLILANVLIFAFTVLLTPEAVAEASVFGFGFIPAVVFDSAVLDPSLVIVPPDATFLTYSFLHVDLMHLGSNMLFLWVFGDNVEDALGHFRFLIFYLACAAAGALFHALVAPLSQAPLIGASGAVSGVVAAYLMLHPKVRIWVLVLFRFPPSCRWPSGSANSSSCCWPTAKPMSPGAPMSAASWQAQFSCCSCAVAGCRCSTVPSSRRLPSGIASSPLRGWSCRPRLRRSAPFTGAVEQNRNEKC